MTHPHVHLLSHHGTLVHADAATDRLRASRLAEAPRNLVLVRDGGLGRLVVTGDGVARPVTRFGPREVVADGNAGGQGIALRVREFGDATTIGCNGLHLLVEPSGVVMFGRERVEYWESFLLLSNHDLDALRRLLDNDWYLHAADRVVRPVLRAGFEVVLGDVVARVDDVLDAFRGDAGGKDVWIMHDGWKFERLLLFRPLVFFSAFHREEGFDCLRVAVRSLKTQGLYAGAIAVLTDRDQDALARTLDEDAAGCVALQTIAGDFLDYLVARFRIAEMPDAANYQPILYADTDIVFNRPVMPLLLRVLRSDALCVAAEQPLMEAEWYGRDLIAQDVPPDSRAAFGFTTGLMAWKNHGIVRPVFDAILRGVYARAKFTQGRGHWGCFDQPVANYLINKGFPVNRDILATAVMSLSHHHGPMEGYDRNGFVHFCGNLGTSNDAGVTKCQRMEIYLDHLDDDARAIGPEAAPAEKLRFQGGEEALAHGHG